MKYLILSVLTCIYAMPVVADADLRPLPMELAVELALEEAKIATELAIEEAKVAVDPEYLPQANPKTIGVKRPHEGEAEPHRFPVFRKSQDGTYRCPFEGCGKPYSKGCYTQLKRHYEKVHILGIADRIKKKARTQFACAVKGCEQTFATKRQLEQHEKLAAQGGTHRCPHCEHSWPSNDSLGQHIRHAHRDKKSQEFACKHCAFTGVYESSLLEHERKNLPPEGKLDGKFPCPARTPCEHTFETKQSAACHVRFCKGKAPEKG